MKPFMLLAAALVAAAAGIALAAGAAAPETAPAEAKPLKVICFGDSITGHLPGEPYHHAYLKFSDLLGLLLEGRLGLGRAEVLNRGWAGDRTEAKGDRPGALARLQKEVIDEHPDIAVVLIAGNDAPKTDEDRSRVLANLEQIFSRLKAAGIRTLALQYHVLPNPENPEKAWTHLDDANDLIARAAAESLFPVLDMGEKMRAAAKETPLKELVSPVDGVHLAPGGEIVYARSIFAKLVELGWAPGPCAPQVSAAKPAAP